MEPRLSIVTLGVDDLDRSVAFYHDGLGLPIHDWTGDIAFFPLQGTWLAVFPRDALAADVGLDGGATGPDDDTAGVGLGAETAPSDRVPDVTLAHNVASTEEVDRTLAEAVDAGGRLVKPAVETDWGGYSGYFADPDGHLWEVAWNPHFDLT